MFGLKIEETLCRKKILNLTTKPTSGNTSLQPDQTVERTQFKVCVNDDFLPYNKRSSLHKLKEKIVEKKSIKLD